MLSQLQGQRVMRRRPVNRVHRTWHARRPLLRVHLTSSKEDIVLSDGMSTFGANALATLEEVQLAAKRKGLNISIKALGPFYRVVCRDGGEEGRILGLTSGFVAPLFGIMHCDMLQILTRGIKGDEGLRVRGGLLGLGLLLGGATFAYGFHHGCRTAEILAINDDDAWHERLVRYYSFFGFRPVCRVGGNGLADIPHMLVWGGEGTRMDADIEAMLRRWTPTIRAAAAGDGGRSPGHGTSGA